MIRFIWKCSLPAGAVTSTVSDPPATFRVTLTAAGVRIDPKREDYLYGRFAWIWDAEGNRVELWQPL